jgi:hypothetical protein
VDVLVTLLKGISPSPSVAFSFSVLGLTVTILVHECQAFTISQCYCCRTKRENNSKLLVLLN